MAYKIGDWVKCPGSGKVLWIYGQIMNIYISPSGLRYWVDRGYMPHEWYGPETLKPAIEPQSPEEVAQTRDGKGGETR